MKKEQKITNSTNFSYVSQIARLPHRRQNEILVSFHSFLSAKILLSLLPYLPREYQTVRALSKITGVSTQLVNEWINDFANLYVKGGDTK